MISNNVNSTFYLYVYVVRVCGTCMWYVYVVRVCGTCMWYVYVVRVCGTCMWYMYVVNLRVGRPLVTHFFIPVFSSVRIP